jgi:hypothetical protein
MRYVTMVVSLGLVGMACASPSGATRAGISDLRGNAAVSGKASRVIVTGPMRLLHANYDRGAGVVFLRAEQQQGTSASDCLHAVPMGWDGESDLTVGEGETICVSAARAAHVSWHARSGMEAAPRGVQHAMQR